MNAGIFNNKPQENTVPSWLLPCTCNTQKCHCNARLKPDILCVKGLPYEAPPPNHIDPNLTIQFIEFKYGNDRFSQEAINIKIEKYQPLINDIKMLGWNIDPLIVIAAGARATTFIPSMTSFEDNLNISIEKIKKTFTAINTIAIQYVMKILLTKRKLENNQTLPNFLDNT